MDSIRPSPFLLCSGSGQGTRKALGRNSSNPNTVRSSLNKRESFKRKKVYFWLSGTFLSKVSFVRGLFIHSLFPFCLPLSYICVVRRKRKARKPSAKREKTHLGYSFFFFPYKILSTLFLNIFASVCGQSRTGVVLKLSIFTVLKPLRDSRPLHGSKSAIDTN